MVQRPNIKYETIKLLKKNTGKKKNLYNFAVGKDILDKTGKVLLITKTKFNKYNQN